MEYPESHSVMADLISQSEIDEKAQAYEMAKTVNNENLAARLRRQKFQAEKEVARLTELIQLLEANPSTERILQLLGR